MSEDWQSWAKDLLLGIEYYGLARNYARLMWQNLSCLALHQFSGGPRRIQVLW